MKNNGVYNGPEACYHWTMQTFAWVIILTVVKILIYGFMVLFSEVLAVFGSIIFAPLQINIRFELLFVMIFFPGFLNVIYFWIADSYLKAAEGQEGAFENGTDKEISLISQEEKQQQDGLNADIVMTEEQHHQQQAMEHTSWGRHAEFIATYLPSWSVFGVQPSPSQDEQEQINSATQTSASTVV